jgi:hypothetical protein
MSYLSFKIQILGCQIQNFKGKLKSQKTKIPVFLIIGHFYFSDDLLIMIVRHVGGHLSHLLGKLKQESLRPAWTAYGG